MARGEEGQRLGQVQSLVRAFGILEALGDGEQGRTLTEIAAATKLPRSTAHRLLTTMNAMRYVEFDAATSRWMIGTKSFVLGASFVRTRDLGRLGGPIMRALMLDAGETVSIAVPEIGNVTFLGQARPVHGQGAERAPGLRLPMHATASGKVLLAHYDEHTRDSFLEANALQRRTALTIVEKNSLVAELSRIRTRGYAIDDQENELGMRCLAAPVFDRKGEVRAALSISGSVSRLAGERLNGLGSTLILAARRMTDQLGELLAA